jgi:hypothetical protein
MQYAHDLIPIDRTVSLDARPEMNDERSAAVPPHDGQLPERSVIGQDGRWRSNPPGDFRRPYDWAWRGRALEGALKARDDVVPLRVLGAEVEMWIADAYVAEGAGDRGDGCQAGSIGEGGRASNWRGWLQCRVAGDRDSLVPATDSRSHWAGCAHTPQLQPRAARSYYSTIAIARHRVLGHRCRELLE